MSLSKNLNAYADIKEILDKFVGSLGGQIAFARHQEAVRWRQRAYQFRKLAVENEAAKYGDIEGYIPSTPYDGLVLSLTPGDTLINVSYQPAPTVAVLPNEEII